MPPNKLIPFLVCFITPLSFASIAHGSETMNVSGTFSDAIGPAGMVVSYCGGAGQAACTDRDPVQVRWGTPAEDEQSGLGFNAESNIVVAPDPFLIGSLNHYNFPIYSGTSTDAVLLSIQVLVETDTSVVVFDELLTMQLEIDETPNDPEFCLYPSTIPCADKVTLVGGPAGNVFTRQVGNVAYVLTVLGFRNDPAGQGDPLEAFISDERQTTNAYMFATFSREILIVADAGVDQTVSEGAPVGLDGSGSIGVDLSYSWTQIDGPPVTINDADTITPSFAAPQVVTDSSATFELVVTDGTYSDSDQVTIFISNINEPPNCAGAGPSVEEMWPPNHKMWSISIDGITDPDGDPLSIQIISVFQDEPVNARGDGNTAPDAVISAGSVELRAERTGLGNGRVYSIFVEVSDGTETCTATITVGVPHDRSGPPIADAFDYDSTASN